MCLKCFNAEALSCQPNDEREKSGGVPEECDNNDESSAVNWNRNVKKIRSCGTWMDTFRQSSGNLAGLQKKETEIL